MTNMLRPSAADATRWMWRLSVTLLAMLLAPLTRAQAAACPVSPASISDCGCTITKPGQTYKIGGPLQLATGKSFCIKIATSNVTLELNGQTLTGNGSSEASVGIDVLPTTSLSAAVKNVAIMGGGTVTSFGIGIRSAAVATSIGITPVAIMGNGTGVVLNGANPFLAGVTASSNADSGIKLNPGASGGALIEITAETQTNGAGIWLNGANGVFMTEIVADSNDTFGVWFDSASNNSLVGFDATNNTLAGVFLGCEDTGPDNTTCKSVKRAPSNGNNIFGDPTTSKVSTADNSDGISGQKWGVAIGKGNVRNHVVEVQGNGNTTDALDENPNCATNIWAHDFFVKFKPNVDEFFCIGSVVL